MGLLVCALLQARPGRRCPAEREAARGARRAGQQALRRRILRPRRRAAPLGVRARALARRRPHHHRRALRQRPPGAGGLGGRVGPALPERRRAALRGGHRPGRGGPARRLPGEGRMTWLESHLLTLATFLPVAGALLVLVLPRGEGGQHKGVAFLFSLLTFRLSIPLWTGFRPGAGRYAFEQRTEWAPALGFSYHVGLDGVALLLFLLTTFLGPIVVLSSWKYIQQRVRLYCAALLLLETAMLGTLASLDLVLFYVFWEAMLIPMYLLIGIWGSDRRIYAAVKFFLFTFIGSVLMLLAIFWLWNNGGRKSFDYVDLLNAGLPDFPTQKWLFLAFALAFAIKVPIWPLHTWLPDAHTEAPAGGSIILAGVMLKMGTFGFIRYAMPLFPHAALELAWTVTILAVIGIDS